MKHRYILVPVMMLVWVLFAFVLPLEESGNWRLSVKEKDGWGLIDVNLNWVIEPQFKDPLIFMDGVFLGSKNEGVQYFDKDGKRLFEKTLLDGIPFSEGLAAVVDKEKVGYIDKSGKWVIEPQFEAGSFFSEGLAAVQQMGSWGYVNKSGEMVIQPVFQEMPLPFVNGLAPAESAGRWGYIDKSGKWVIQPSFSRASFFREGRATVEVDGLEGLIDTSGAFVVEPQKRGLVYSGDGRWLSLTDSAMAFIDKEGKRVFDKEFDALMLYGEGLAGFSKDGKSGYMDKDGNTVFSIGKGEGGRFMDGYAVFRRAGDYFLINKKGETVTELNFERIDRWGSVVGYSFETILISREWKLFCQKGIRGGSIQEVAGIFLTAMQAEDYETAKEYASRESRTAIDLMAGVARELKTDPMPGIAITRVEENGAIATVHYLDKADGLEKTLELMLEDGKWVAIFTKEDKNKLDEIEAGPEEEPMIEEVPQDEEK